MTTPPQNIEPIRKALCDLLNTRISFEDVHNEIILLDAGLPPVNTVLSEMIVQIQK